MKFESVVTEIGKDAIELFELGGGLIIFDDNAPAGLAEIAVLHTQSDFKDDIEVGDKLIIGSSEYKITAVGSEALHTLKEMGHCSIKFDGKSSVELPGQIEVKGNDIPNPKVGDMLAFK